MSKKLFYLVLVLAFCLTGMLTAGELIKVNFQLAGAEVPEGYLPDTGLEFGDRGNGYSYGWSQNMTDQTRDRNNSSAPDQRYDTLIHFRARGAVWEIVLDPGFYRVFIVCGDPSNADSNNQIELEGELLAEDPDGMDSFDEFEFTVLVSDGRLTWSEPEGSYVKPCFIEIESSKPIVRAVKPDPKDGVLYEDTWVNLSWTPGEFAVSHDIYLGDNFDDVNDGTAETFQGNQASTYFVAGFPGFPYPDGLAPGTTYYWRVDEVNDAEPNSPWKGDVWSFWIPSKTAYEPDPPDGVKFVDPEVELGWTAGFGAKLHHVYFGDNFDDVNDGVVGMPQATITYTPGTLEMDKVYYWRIDEFDGVVTHKGDVWSFRTLPIIDITDPNLLGWWMLDEGYGTTVLDWSGQGSHGTLEGDPEWVAGYDGDALDLDGAGDNVYAAAINLPTNAFTVALWFNSNSALNDSSPRKDFLYWQNGSRPHLTFNRSGTGEIGLWPNIGEDFDGPLTATRSWAAGTWYHIAGTFDGASFKIYVNGNLENVVNHPGIHGDASGLLIGCRTDQRNYFDGKIDDVRLYDTALTQEAIKLAMRGDTTLAWGPSPANGSTLDIDEVMPLSWSPGDNAAQHDVYFGTDRDAVDNADTSTPDVYRGRQGATSYTPGEGVEWGQSYYWRIDEYNTDETINKGRVWSFMVADYLTVDDFEAYNDLNPDDPESNRIFNAWLDGYGIPTNGSIVGYENPPFAEQTIVHSGNQSMPLYYDNSVGYSEAILTLSSRRDWTKEGVNTLTIWFRGSSANAAETLYVALNGSAVVSHDNPNAAQTATWTQWNIDLQAFADQGVNLANVNSIALGLGNRNNPVAGGSGTMYFDDIRLYPPSEPAP